MTKATGKMILTFNETTYSQLLSKYLPRIIKDEQDNEQFLAIVEELLAYPNLTPEEDAILELLVKLIEDFEEKHYQLNASTSHSRLLHLMDVTNVKKADLVGIFGSGEVTENVINGEVEMSYAQAKKLGEFFNVDSSLFLSKKNQSIMP
ncbi:MAG: transcriptional regulator [Cyanobacteria bacterium P01_G01_bin.49]